MKQIKNIAFYLPQYHCIPENDMWWGKGFTEWVNVKKAFPLYKNHNQPRIPLNKNYYNLDTTDEMIRQAEMAKKYGVYGFCYYHYWFGKGKKLLEKPIEQMLSDNRVDIPFCLCWANENWTRNWDGGNREVLICQDYGSEDTWKDHIEYLRQYLNDDRYIRVKGQPILLIYKPEIIPRFNDMIDYWNSYLTKKGEHTLIIYSQYPSRNVNYNDYKLDGIVKFEPVFATNYLRHNGIMERVKKNIYMKWRIINGVHIYDYDRMWKYILEREPQGEKYIPGAFIDWDNTARNKKGTSYQGATPQKFKMYYERLVQQINDGKYSTELVFINAWNEWAEGAYLEPDEKNRYGYLESIKKVLDGEKR